MIKKLEQMCANVAYTFLIAKGLSKQGAEKYALKYSAYSKM